MRACRLTSTSGSVLKQPYKHPAECAPPRLGAGIPGTLQLPPSLLTELLRQEILDCAELRPSDAGQNFFHQLQPFTAELGGKHTETGDVSPRSSEA